MSGALHILRPGASAPEIEPFTGEEPPLERLQALVDGYVEAVNVPYLGRTVIAFCNEDGLSRRLPPNPLAYALLREAQFVGVVVLWV